MKSNKNIKLEILGNLSKTYLFPELHKSRIYHDNIKPIINKLQSYSFADILDYNPTDININNTDKYSNQNLLKEISEIIIKKEKYKNELNRAKRENKIQNKYKNSLEQKYILQLISKKENINYLKIKKENQLNKKDIMNKTIINKSDKINNCNNSNYIYKNNIINNNRIKLTKNSCNIPNYISNDFCYKEFKRRMLNKKKQ